MIVMLALVALAASAAAGSLELDYSTATASSENTNTDYSGLNTPSAVAFTNEGDVAVGFSLSVHGWVVLSQTDLTALHTVADSTDDVYVGLHGDGLLLVADQSTPASLSSYDTSSYPLGGASASVDISANCPSAISVRAQQTGSKRVFLTCSTTHFCRYDADLSNEDCTTQPSDSAFHQLNISPDDSFVVVFTVDSDGIPRLLKIDAETLATVFTLDVNSVTTGTFDSTINEVLSVSIRSDNTVVIPDHDNDGVHTLDFSGSSAPTGATFTDLASLNCDQTEGVFGAQYGTGDIVVACDGGPATDRIVVLPGDLDTGNAHEIATDAAGASLGISPATGDGLSMVAFTYGAVAMVYDNPDDVVLFGTPGAPATESATETATATHSESATQSVTPTQSQTATQTFVPKPPPGSVGDPILVDFAGHRFMGGARGRTEYLLYRSQDGAEAITMTTGVVQGAEHGFFAVAVAVERAGCGTLRIAAVEAEEHVAEISGDACMTARVARGDSGMVLVPIGEGGDTGSVLAVYPHQQGDSPAFLNMRLLATTPEFQAGCTGMLCNEAHGDIEA